MMTRPRCGTRLAGDNDLNAAGSSYRKVGRSVGTVPGVHGAMIGSVSTVRSCTTVP